MLQQAFTQFHSVSRAFACGWLHTLVKGFAHMWVALCIRGWLHTLVDGLAHLWVALSSQEGWPWAVSGGYVVLKVTFSSGGWLLRLASGFAHLCVAFSSFTGLLAIVGGFAHLFSSMSHLQVCKVTKGTQKYEKATLLKHKATQECFKPTKVVQSHPKVCEATCKSINPYLKSVLN